MISEGPGPMRKPTRPHEDEPKTPTGGEVSGLLRAWSEGDRGALDRLTPIAYDELRPPGAGLHENASAPATACKRRPWSTRPTCAWWTVRACSGRIAPIFSRFRPS